MNESLFKQLGGAYHEENGYLIPDLLLPAEEEQPIGIWGQRHLDYLKQYCKVTYTNLLTSGKLNAYLISIDRQAQERFERLIEGMKQAQGITGQKRQGEISVAFVMSRILWILQISDFCAMSNYDYCIN